MQDVELDDRDYRILDELQRDGALTNAELAERVNLSPSACLRRVNLLKESGLIEGTHLILDQAKAGFKGTAYLFIALKGQDRDTLDKFEAAMTKVPHVLECYLLAGEYDYLLRVGVSRHGRSRTPSFRSHHAPARRRARAFDAHASLGQAHHQPAAARSVGFSLRPAPLRDARAAAPSGIAPASGRSST